MKRMHCVLMSLFLVAALVSAEGQSAEQKKVMKFAGTTPAGKGIGEYEAMVLFGELVEKYSQGTIDVQIFPAAQLGSSPEFTEGVALGTIEAAVAGYDNITPLKPDVAALCLPYLFTDYAQMRRVLETDTKTKQMTDEYMKEVNLKLVGYVYRPFRVVGNNVRPVRSPEDLRGVKTRSPDATVFLETIAALGASPMVQAWSELYPSLAQGTLDGCENSITEIVSTNFQEVLKYISETRHMCSAIAIFVGLNWFNGLTSEEQNAIIKAGAETTQWRFEQVQKEEEAAWQKCRDNNVQVIHYADLDIAPFQNATANIHKEFIAQGIITEEYYNQIISDAGAE